MARALVRRSQGVPFRAFVAAIHDVGRAQAEARGYAG
jgi:hypothetical protein